MTSIMSGTNYELEAAANELLRQSRVGVTKLSEKKDYFTEEQLMLRQKREICNGHGFPESHIVSGLYNRAYNPHSGKRPSKSRHSDDG